MRGGAVQLRQYHVFVKADAARSVNGRRAGAGKFAERSCHFTTQPSSVSFSGSAVLPSILPLRRDALNVLGGGGLGRARSSRRFCSESGIVESTSEAGLSHDSSGIPSETGGASYTTTTTGPGGFSATAPPDRLEENLHTFGENFNDGQLPSSLVGSSEEDQSLFNQIREILVFAGPALGIWLSGPVMSIIDTAVIGNSSSLELAALGPGTVLCDSTCYVFMFLSIATSNLIATSLAQKDESGAAGHLSRLLFVSLFCGVGMLLITECFATPLLQAFVGVKNYSLIPAARLYVQIRALAWPIVLTGLVAQSASLGMQDSWAPLKALAIASSVNLVGDILLCVVFDYGIGGAAWATMASQYVGGYLLLKSVGDKGYDPLAISVPSWIELINMFNLAAPILLTLLSKVIFFTITTFLATSLGSTTLAAHQVMINIFFLCTVWGEPLSQTAQSFMPALIFGSNRNFKQARALLQTLILIGASLGVTLGCIAISVPWFVPQIFTSDSAIVGQMRALTAPFFLSLMVTPSALSCEGTLLAGRDMNYLGFSMASCLCGGTFVLVMLDRLGFGLVGSWWSLVVFQVTRFILSYSRLSGPKSFLADRPSSSQLEVVQLKDAANLG